MDGFQVSRFKIVNDGRARFVLVDEFSDDPAPVFPSYDAADAELVRRVAELGQGAGAQE